MRGLEVSEVRARKLDVPLKEPFEIATGAQSSVRNVLVRVRLRDGTTGYGECAPLPAFNGETQAQALSAVRRAAGWLAGRDAASWAALARDISARVAPGSARAGLEMAILDAWGRSRGIPLWALFGGAGVRIATDVTIPIVSPAAAARAAARIARLKIRALKIKVGKDPEEDAERVHAAISQMRGATLIADGNGGFDARSALDFLRRLKSKGVVCDLFEQPVPKDDLHGLRAVARVTTVAADESASSPAEVLRLARLGAAHVVNIKLMKAGVLAALETARAARAAGLGLMIGGMIESRLAMTCAAHLAAGLGGFRFVDLDTPLYFARETMRGGGPGPGGVYDLSRVRGGIGVIPRN